jgi:hypothetical protein
MIKMDIHSNRRSDLTRPTCKNCSSSNPAMSLSLTMLHPRSSFRIKKHNARQTHTQTRPQPHKPAINHCQSLPATSPLQPRCCCRGSAAAHEVDETRSVGWCFSTAAGLCIIT